MILFWRIFNKLYFIGPTVDHTTGTPYGGYLYVETSISQATFAKGN